VKPKSDPDKIVLGMDPGTRVMGYALIGIRRGQPELLQFGILDLKKLGTHELRLKRIFERVLSIVDEYHPDEVAIESPFYGKNVQSMLKLGRAQGVAMAAVLHRGIPIVEYAPRKIKQSVTGKGNASKEQVAGMLKQIFGLKKMPSMLDASDALAVALCHHFQKTGGRRVKMTWSKFIEDHPDRVN
jgi:crossover junction endodeoxyribonuclease RuvC